MEFHHIGIVCKNIENEIHNIKKIHDVNGESAIIFDREQNAKLCMLTVEDGLKIELISGEQINSLIKRKFTYYHICYTVADLPAKITEFLSNGAILISPPKPAVLFNGKKVAFLYVSYGLIELLEN